MHPHSAMPLSRLSGELSAQRSVLAEQIVIAVVDRLPDAVGVATPLFARTLVTALAKAIELGDVDVVRAWSRMASANRPRPVILAMIDEACRTIERHASTREIDLSAVIVLLEIIRSECRMEAAAATWGVNRDEAPRAAISAILALLKARDEGTCTHSYATGMWCERLCATLGLSASLTERIVRAGILHDVGKMATPDAILLKPGPLDAAEWSIMVQHAADGAEILSEIPSLASYAPIIRAHHERVDGNGYPDALAGNDIPYESRVLAVADAFHAMISERPYRPAMSIGRASAILMAERGRHWDAEIVDAMVATAAAARNDSTDAILEQTLGIGLFSDDGTGEFRTGTM